MVMGKNDSAPPSRNFLKEIRQLKERNDKLNALMIQKDATIDRLNREIAALKAKMEGSKMEEKDKAIDRLNSENAKLKHDLSIAKMFSP